MSIKTDGFERIKGMYEESFRANGDSPAALLTPKGKHALRFRVMDEVRVEGPYSLLDYGCGLGYLLEFLRKREHPVRYTGVDILPSFVEACRTKFPEGADFHLVDPKAQVQGRYDVVFSSGVFNIKLGENEAQSKAYAFAKIEELFAVAEQALVCDFLSGFVDFRQPDSMHFGVEEIAEFCCRRLSRRFVIRHDLLPYEFTLITYKDAAIKRPDNVFEVDAGIL